MLANRIDAESAARAQGVVEFQEFRETWIGEMESIQETSWIDREGQYAGSCIERPGA